MLLHPFMSKALFYVYYFYCYYYLLSHQASQQPKIFVFSLLVHSIYSTSYKADINTNLYAQGHITNGLRQNTNSCLKGSRATLDFSCTNFPSPSSPFW